MYQNQHEHQYQHRHGHGHHGCPRYQPKAPAQMRCPTNNAFSWRPGWQKANQEITDAMIQIVIGRKDEILGLTGPPIKATMFKPVSYRSLTKKSVVDPKNHEAVYVFKIQLNEEDEGYIEAVFINGDIASSDDPTSDAFIKTAIDGAPCHFVFQSYKITADNDMRPNENGPGKWTEKNLPITDEVKQMAINWKADILEKLQEVPEMRSVTIDRFEPLLYKQKEEQPFEGNPTFAYLVKVQFNDKDFLEVCFFWNGPVTGTMPPSQEVVTSTTVNKNSLINIGYFYQDQFAV